MGFFGSFFGNDQRKDLQRANAQATQALDKGYADSMQRYDQAAGLLDPYAQSGAEGNAMYAALLRGDPDAIAQFNANPILQGNIGQASNAMMRYLNARGGAAGGTGAAAMQRVGQQGAMQFLDQYRGLGQQGFQAAGAQAGIRQGQGDAAYGFGATKAGQAINYGNAMAGTRNIGINNLLNLAGTGIKAATAAYGAPGGGGFMR